MIVVKTNSVMAVIKMLNKEKHISRLCANTRPIQARAGITAVNPILDHVVFMGYLGILFFPHQTLIKSYTFVNKGGYFHVDHQVKSIYSLLYLPLHHCNCNPVSIMQCHGNHKLFDSN